MFMKFDVYAHETILTTYGVYINLSSTVRNTYLEITL